MFKKILVGLDGSDRQSAVVRHAVELATKHDAKLTLCRAVQVPRSIPAIAWALQGEAFDEFLVNHARKQLRHLAEMFPVGMVESTVGEIAQPADLICKLAESHEIDLIVIGSHGYYGLDRVLGTTAAKVVNRAKCCVIVVRDKAPAPSKR